MALTFTNLATTGDTTDQTNYTTASVSPTGNRLLLLAVLTSAAAATVPTVTSISGNGLTWVEVGTSIGYNSTGTPARRLTVFRAMGASPSAGAITINHSGACNGCMWSVIQSSADVDTSGTNGSGAIVQTQSNASGSATSLAPSPSLSAFGDAVNNACVVFGVVNDNTAWTPDATPAGWVELGDAAITTPSVSITSAYLTGQDTAPTVTKASGAAAPMAVRGIEVKYAAAGGGGGFGSLLARSRNRLVVTAL